MKTSVRLTGAFLCLLVTTAPVAHIATQINPYKEGTPAVTGYRSEVLAEVIDSRR
jgi:hypothetical protein